MYPVEIFYSANSRNLVMHDISIFLSCMNVLCIWYIWCILFVQQTLENIKLIQIEKFHKAKSDFERESIELDPKKILHHAVENCKPLLITLQIHKGGVMYQVLCLVLSDRIQSLPDSRLVIRSCSCKLIYNFPITNNVLELFVC